MRLVIARCSVDYVGRLKAHLPLATRLLLVKADGSVLVHSDGGSYKPLNWMSPPASLRVSTPDEVDVEVGVVEQWTVQSAKTDDRLIINIHEQLHDTSHELGQDPGLIKDGVEADLQRLLADQIELLGTGFSLIRREYFTAIGPVDILARDADGATVAIELKRRGDIDGVEQLTRYLELLNRDPLLAPVRGIFAPSRSSRRPRSWPTTAASTASPWTTTPCAASTTANPGSSKPALRRPFATAAIARVKRSSSFAQNLCNSPVRPLT